MSQWLEIAALAAQGLQGLIPAGSGENPTEQVSMGRRRIGPETELERLLAGMQGGLGTMGMLQTMQGSGATLGAIDPTRLAAGDIGGGARQRIEEQSTLGLDRAIQQAMYQADQQAGRRGIGLSSVQGAMQANLMQPAVIEAQRTAAELYNQELMRQQGLRQQALENLLTMQNMPALNRLLQIRMAESQEQQYSTQREAGDEDFWRHVMMNDWGMYHPGWEGDPHEQYSWPQTWQYSNPNDTIPMSNIFPGNRGPATGPGMPPELMPGGGQTSLGGLGPLTLQQRTGTWGMPFGLNQGPSGSSRTRRGQQMSMA